MTFEFFDPDQPTAVNRRHLPHWFQPGVTYFLTFRTTDSMPRDVLDRWYAERGQWLRQHGIDPVGDAWQSALRSLPPGQQREFHLHFSAAYHAALDRGHGECLLRRPELARVVAASLLHFDGRRYHMGDFVVMPNHVHALVCLCGETTLAEQCLSWKKFTASRINQALGRRGHFWQGETFDHLVRGPDQFGFFRQYIADNPRKAGLREGEYYLYPRPM